MQRKRNLAFIIALILALGVLAGCAGSGGAAGTGAGNNDKSDSSAALPNGQKPTLKILRPYWNVDLNKDPLKKIVDESTGYTTDWYLLPQNNADEKLLIELSSGADYDIVNTNKAMISKLAAQGALTDLGPLIDKYAPNLRKAYSPQSLQQMTFGGKLYAIPTNKNIPFIHPEIIVRKDLLDELKLNVPQTLDEFTNVLRVIKDKKGVIPLTGTGYFYDTIASAFGLSTYWKDENGTLVPRLKQKGMVDYLKYMNMLYKEGLLDPESPANKPENRKEKFANGKAAMTLFFWNDWQMLPVVKQNFPGSSVAYLLPLKGKNGEQEINISGAGYGAGSIIPKSAKHPENAIKFLGKFAEPDVFKKIYIGDEGVHYKIVNGSYEPITDKFEAERKISWTYLMVTPEKETKDAFPIAIKGEDPNVFESFNELYKAFPYGKVDPTTYLETPESSSKYLKSLQQLEEDMFIKFIAGAEPFENYNKFVQNWESQGGKQMEDDMNKVYKSSK